MYYQQVNKPGFISNSHRKLKPICDGIAQRSFPGAVRGRNRPAPMDNGCDADSPIALLFEVKDCRVIAGTDFITRWPHVVTNNDAVTTQHRQSSED